MRAREEEKDQPTPNTLRIKKQRMQYHLPKEEASHTANPCLIVVHTTVPRDGAYFS